MIPLVVALFAVAVAFVSVAAGASVLHLERLRLLTIADGAALASAESFRVDDARVTGGTVVPTLTDAEVGSAAGEYVAEADPGDLRGLRLVRAGTDDGRSATVVLRANWRPPIASAFLPVAVPVEVSSTAAARFR